MRPRRFWKILGISLAAVVGLVLLALVGSWWWFTRPIQIPVPEGDEPVKGPATMYVLVMGVDERPGDRGRSDTMFVVRLQEGSDDIDMLSIPRDTRIELPGHGVQKINAAYAYGGPAMAQEAVNDLLGIKVNHYVKINMDGFRELVDILGGVTVDVPKATPYHNEQTGERGVLQPGVQRLDGAQAESLVRFRKDEIGDDLSRIRRQQDFVKTVLQQTLVPGNVTRFPAFLKLGQEHVDTDITFTEQMRLLNFTYGATQRGEIRQSMIPGHGQYIGEISYFLVDYEKLEQFLSNWR